MMKHLIGVIEEHPPTVPNTRQDGSRSTGPNFLRVMLEPKQDYIGRYALLSTKFMQYLTRGSQTQPPKTKE